MHKYWEDELTLPHTAHVSVKKPTKILLTLLFLRLRLISCHCEKSKSVRLPSVQTEPSQPGWGPGLHSSKQHVSISRSGTEFCIWRLQKTVRNGLQQCECVRFRTCWCLFGLFFSPSILSWFSGMRKFGTDTVGWECSCLQFDDRDVGFPYRVLEFPRLKTSKQTSYQDLTPLTDVWFSRKWGKKITSAQQQNTTSRLQVVWNTKWPF